MKLTDKLQQVSKNLKIKGWKSGGTLLYGYEIYRRDIEHIPCINIWDPKKKEMHFSGGIQLEDYCCIQTKKTVIIANEKRLFIINEYGIEEVHGVLKDTTIDNTTPGIFIDEGYIILEKEKSKFLARITTPLKRNIVLAADLLSDLVKGEEITSLNYSLAFYKAKYDFLQFNSYKRGKIVLNTITGAWLESEDKENYISNITWNRELNRYCLFSDEKIQLIKEGDRGEFIKDYSIICTGIHPSKLQVFTKEHISVITVIAERDHHVLFSKDTNGQFVPNSIIGNKMFDHIDFHDSDNTLRLLCGGHCFGFDLEKQQLAELADDYPGLECPHYDDCKDCGNRKIEKRQEAVA